MEVDRKEDALFYYHQWRMTGKPLSSRVKVKLDLKGTRAVVKALMPCVAPTMKVAEHIALYKIAKWLYLGSRELICTPQRRSAEALFIAPAHGNM